MSNWVSPGLHIKLGLGLALLTHLKLFAIQYVELQSTALLEAFDERAQLIAIISQRCAARDAHKATASTARADDWRAVWAAASVEIKKLRGSLQKTQEKVAAERRQQKCKPVRDAMEQFLREHGVEEQAFYHGALVGTHINRMLTHHPSILLGIESVMRNTTLRRPDPWADGSTY